MTRLFVGRGTTLSGHGRCLAGLTALAVGMAVWLSPVLAHGDSLKCLTGTDPVVAATQTDCDLCTVGKR